MEKRVLLAAAVSVLILAAWIQVTNHFFPQPAPGPATEPPAAHPSQLVPQTEELEGSPEAAAPAEPIAAEVPEQIEVENEMFSLTLTNRGAAAVSWSLRQYTVADGGALQLFPEFVAGADRPMLLSTELDDAERTAKLGEAVYRVERERLPADADESGERITFTWSDGRGLWTRKALILYDHSYLVDVELEVVDNGRPLPARLVLGPGFSVQEPGQRRSTYYYDGQAVFDRGGDVVRLKKKQVASEPGAISGPFYWAGLEDQYFAALVLPGAATSHAQWRGVEVTPLPDPQHAAQEATAEPVLAVLVPPAGAKLFIGPKKYTLLRDLGFHLEDVVYFSSITFLAWITRAIFQALLWIHDHTVQNYGMAIVLSTFLLRLLLFPVNQYSMVSMKKAQLQMQRLQPKVKAIKAKYKKAKDAEGRARMNQEMMEMYRQEGVNPMGGLTGCLPLLAQFPILIGFYNMLTVAIELRGAPFFGWIQDLSREDPYWITPLLMGVTMFVQQKMAMSKVKDPQQLQQQRMMLFMPVVFTYICLNMPSGMVLYWFVNNVLGIGQQWLVNRHTARLETAHQEA